MDAIDEGARRFSLAEDSPCFDGHFDGAPILPGIAHLALALTACARESGQARVLTGLPAMCASCVRSGPVTRSRSSSRPVTCRTRCASSSAAAARKPAAGCSSSARRSIGAVTELPLLPHTGTALLLTTVVRSDATSIEATGLVPAAHPLVCGGRAPAILGLELGAQAAAAMEALARAVAATSRGPRLGYVVRDPRSRVPSIRPSGLYPDAGDRPPRRRGGTAYSLSHQCCGRGCGIAVGRVEHAERPGH